MTQQTADNIDRMVKWAQFLVALTALIGAFVYAGQRSERDEHQTKALEKMASDLGKIQESASESGAQIRVLGERVRGLEDRVGRIERK